MTSTQDQSIPGTSLTTDIATHKLTVKLEDMGKFKTFYLTEKEAEWISKTINGPEQFIVLSKAADPNAPSAYPKRGAWLERMDPRERERQLQEKAIRQAATAQAEREVQDRVTLTLVTNRWIETEPEQYEEVRRLVLAHRDWQRTENRLPRLRGFAEETLERYAVWGHVFNALKNSRGPLEEARALPSGSHAVP